MFQSLLCAFAMRTLEFTSWSCATCLLYTYVLYPVVLAILARDRFVSTTSP